MAEFKNNHYVPQWLIKNFCIETGNTYYFDKTKPDKPIILRNPDSIFCKNNLYVRRSRTGERDVSLETDKFSPIDNDAKVLFCRIIDCARNNRLPNLSPDEKSLFSNFIYQQFRRTPDRQNSTVPNVDLEQLVNTELIALQDQSGAIDAALHERIKNQITELKKPENFARMIHNGKVKALKSRDPLLEQMLVKRGFIIARTKNPNCSFVLGSNPILKIHYPNRSSLSDLTVEMWLPISHDIAVCSCGNPTDEKLTLISLESMRYLNELTFSQSTEIAGTSMKLLESLTKLWVKNLEKNGRLPD